MTTLTLDEQERRAYANGDTRTAELLAAAADALEEADAAAASITRLEDERDELKAECEKLRAAMQFA